MKMDRRWLLFGTEGFGVNGFHVPVNYTPTNYTPTSVGTEGTDKLSAHLKGLDLKLSSTSQLETKDIVTSDTATTIVNTTASRTLIVSNYTGGLPRYVQLENGVLGQEVMVADGAYTATTNPLAIIGALSSDVSLTHNGQVVTMVWIGKMWSVISFGEPIPPPNSLVDQSNNVLVDQFGNTLTGGI